VCSRWHALSGHTRFRMRSALALAWPSLTEAQTSAASCGSMLCPSAQARTPPSGVATLQSFATTGNLRGGSTISAAPTAGTTREPTCAAGNAAADFCFSSATRSAAPATRQRGDHTTTYWSRGATASRPGKTRRTLLSRLAGGTTLLRQVIRQQHLCQCRHRWPCRHNVSLAIAGRALECAHVCAHS
jgi:hypothetical protein